MFPIDGPGELQDGEMNAELITSIIDFLPDATFVIDNHEKVIAWNKAMENMTRLDRQDILGKDDYAYALPFYGERRPMLINSIFNNEDEWRRYNYDYVKRHGNVIYAESYVSTLNGGPAHLWGIAAPLFDDQDNIRGAIESVRDVTTMKKAEKALNQETGRFLTLTEEAPISMMLIKGSRFTYLNEKFRQTFGYSIQDIPDGRTWFRKAYPDPAYRRMVVKTWLHDIQRFSDEPSLRESKRWTYNVTCKDGRRKIITFVCVALAPGEYLVTLEDITQQKIAEKELERRKIELDAKSKNLEEINTALRVLLKQREDDKIRLEEKILLNVKELVMPYVKKLQKGHLDPDHRAYVDVIEENLKDIVSPFAQNMGLNHMGLTPTELEIANLIKNGKRTKEIGKMLHMSQGAINFHRNNVRKKLGLIKQKTNLRSYLLSIQKI